MSEIYYTTNREINFLKNLGKGVHQDNALFYKHNSRLSLLKGYQKGIEQRVNWDCIDKDTIFEYVKRAIARCRGGHNNKKSR